MQHAHALEVEGHEDLIAEPVSLDFISTEDDPELASQASEAALTGDRPLMANAPSGQVELPGGWFDPQGNLLTSAVVKELTGHAEEKLSRIDLQANFPLFLQTLTRFGLENIGGHEPTDQMMNDLLIGDREALILGIRIATYGPEVEMHIQCPECRAEEDIAIELDKDIPVDKMAEPEKREYEVELRNGRTAIVHPTTCGIQDLIWDPKKTAAEMKTAALDRCVRTIDGRPVTTEEIRDLGLADRNALITKLTDLQPGPDFGGVKIPCESCGQEFNILLDLTDLFR